MTTARVDATSVEAEVIDIDRPTPSQAAYAAFRDR